jgi:hypothetical protein
MEELEREYIEKLLMKILEEIRENEKKFNKAKNLEERLEIIEKLWGTEVHKSDFIKLYNEVFEANSKYVENLKLIYDKYNKKLLEEETNEK